MALAAYLNLQLLLGGTGGKPVTTGADYLGVSIVLGVNLVFHDI